MSPNFSPKLLIYFVLSMPIKIIRSEKRKGATSLKKFRNKEIINNPEIIILTNKVLIFLKSKKVKQLPARKNVPSLYNFAASI